jgi:hypothetical protein
LPANRKYNNSAAWQLITEIANTTNARNPNQYTLNKHDGKSANATSLIIDAVVTLLRM